MTAGWIAAVAAGAGTVGTLAGLLWRAGRREGKLDEILARLTDMADDHEDRIRVLERRPGRWRADPHAAPR